MYNSLPDSGGAQRREKINSWLTPEQIFTSKIERVSWNDHKKNNQIYIGLLNLNNETNLTQTRLTKPERDAQGKQVFESAESSPFHAP